MYVLHIYVLYYYIYVLYAYFNQDNLEKLALKGPSLFK